MSLDLDPDFHADAELAQDLVWSPRQSSTAPVHRHWLVQSGSPPSPSSHDLPDRLALVAESITGLDASKAIFYSLTGFHFCCELLLEHVGFIDHQIDSTLTPAFKSGWYFRLNARLLLLKTMGSTSHPKGFVLDSDEFHTRLAAFSESSVYQDELRRRIQQSPHLTDAFDAIQVFWNAGVQVNRRMGFHLPYKRYGGKPSPLERVISFLTDAEDRMSKYDQWAATLASSALLASLIRSGQIGPDGHLLDPGVVELRPVELADFFGIEHDSKQDRTLRQYVWAASRHALFRQAIKLRNDRIATHGESTETISSPLAGSADGQTAGDMLASFEIAQDIKNTRLALSSSLTAQHRCGFTPRLQSAGRALATAATEIDSRLKSYEDFAGEQAETIIERWRQWRTKSKFTPIPKPLHDDSTLLRLERRLWPGSDRRRVEYRPRKPNVTTSSGTASAGLDDDDEEQITSETEEPIGLNIDNTQISGHMSEDVIAVPEITWDNLPTSPLHTLESRWKSFCAEEVASLTEPSVGLSSDHTFFVVITAIESVLRSKEAAQPWLLRHGFVNGQTGLTNSPPYLASNLVVPSGFKGDSFDRCLASIAAVPLLDPDLINQTAFSWATVTEALAVSTALAICSSRHYLFPQFSTLLLDRLSRRITLPDPEHQDYPRVSATLAAIHVAKEYSLGLTVSASVGTRSYGLGNFKSHKTKDQLINTMAWTSSLISPSSRFGYLESDGTLIAACQECGGQTPRIPASAIIATDQSDRLSVSTAIIRRGADLGFTRGFGNLSFCDCLSALFALRYNREFLPAFISFAVLHHQIDKVGFNKASFVMTSHGPRLVHEMLKVKYLDHDASSVQSDSIN